MTEHFCIRNRGHRVGLALAAVDQVAENLQVIFFFWGKVATIQFDPVLRRLWGVLRNARRDGVF